MIWTWLVRLFSGWLPIDGQRLGKILWIAGLFLVFQFAFGKLFNKSDSNTNQRATNGGIVSSTNIAPKVSLGGCAHIRVYSEPKEK